MSDFWNIFYIISSVINLLLPLEGFIKMHKTKKDYLLRGGFVFFNFLNLASWAIYGFLSNNLKYSNPIFLGVAIIYLFVALIFFEEYANIVYHNVIIVNYSWWIRQQKIDLIFKMNQVTSGLFLTIPHLLTFYYSLRKQNKEYLSYTQIFGHFSSALFYIIYCIYEGYIILTILTLVKVMILVLQVLLYKKLEKKEILEEISKKEK